MRVSRAGHRVLAVSTVLLIVACAPPRDTGAGSGGANGPDQHGRPTPAAPDRRADPPGPSEPGPRGPAPSPPPPVPPTPPTTSVRLPSGRDTTVTFVVDGDTIAVGGGERVRLIGINTPETSDPRRGVECYGSQAAARTAAILPAGTRVRLVFDVERTDRYGRTLAYVYRLPDGLFVNGALVADGYAQVATYPPNVAHAAEFRYLERLARLFGAGLWSACRAPGRPAPPPPPPPPPPAAPPPAPGGGGCDPAYPGVCIPPPPPDLDCAQVPYRRFAVRAPDPHGFDADLDGIGCE